MMDAGVELTREDIEMKLSEFAEKGKMALRKRNGTPKFLRLMARFPEFSVENLILLFAQRPDAKILGTREMWENTDNAIREETRGIWLLSDDEPELWYDIIDTMDVPNEEVMNSPGFYIGILPNAVIRKKSPFYQMLNQEPYRSIRMGVDYDGEAMKKLAMLLVYGAPFGIKAADIRRWRYFQDWNNPFQWNDQRKTLSVRRGVSGEELVMKLIMYRAYMVAKDQGAEAPMEVAKGVTYVIGCMLRIGGFGEMVPMGLKTFVSQDELDWIAEVMKAVCFEGL